MLGKMSLCVFLFKQAEKSWHKNYAEMSANSTWLTVKNCKDICTHALLAWIHLIAGNAFVILTQVVMPSNVQRGKMYSFSDLGHSTKRLFATTRHQLSTQRGTRQSDPSGPQVQEWWVQGMLNGKLLRRFSWSRSQLFYYCFPLCQATKFNKSQWQFHFHNHTFKFHCEWMKRSLLLSIISIIIVLDSTYVQKNVTCYKYHMWLVTIWQWSGWGWYEVCKIDHVVVMWSVNRLPTTCRQLNLFTMTCVYLHLHTVLVDTTVTSFIQLIFSCHLCWLYFEGERFCCVIMV